jgi:hypothetical protein
MLLVGCVWIITVDDDGVLIHRTTIACWLIVML